VFVTDCTCTVCYRLVAIALLYNLYTLQSDIEQRTFIWGSLVRGAYVLLSRPQYNRINCLRYWPLIEWHLTKWQRYRRNEAMLNRSTRCPCTLIAKPLVSLELVSPGAATQGVTPIFSWNNWRSFLVIDVCHFYSVSPLFARHYHFIAFTRVSPPRWCHPAPFSTCPTSFVHCSL